MVAISTEFDLGSMTTPERRGEGSRSLRSTPKIHHRREKASVEAVDGANRGIMSSGTYIRTISGEGETISENLQAYFRGRRDSVERFENPMKIKIFVSK